MKRLCAWLLGAWCCMGLEMGVAAAENSRDTAIFAGGCFWCMQPVFDAAEGVISTQVGYTGGHVANPSYNDVTRGDSGHSEAILITYDPSRISYRALTELFFRNIDPFDAQGQFADKGSWYETAVFVRDDMQREIAADVIQQLAQRFADKKIATRIRDRAEFYPAEEYHQSYYRKNSMHYNLYKHGSGRVTGLKEIWGK